MNAQKSIRMLLLDNKMVTSDLDRAGYRNMGVFVKTAASYKEGEKILAEGQVDIIVINHDYDEVDANTVTKHLKANGEFAEIPVVVTSVQTAAKVKRAALEAGADLFVEQPLPRQYFIEKLKKLLEKQTRDTERVAVGSEIEYVYQGKTTACPIGDLSISGVLLSTTEELPAGSSVELSFPLPGYKKPIQVTGEVVRFIKPSGDPERKSGLGVRFADFKGDSHKRLEKYIEKESTKDERMLYYL